MDVPSIDVISINVSRSDANIANFYWVQSARFNLIYDAFQKQEASASGDKTVNLGDYDNASVKLYGVRLMSLETQQGPTTSTSQSSGGKAAEVEKAQQSTVEWMADRRRIVSESNKDNVVMESGSMRLRGNEKIKAGCYIRLKRGDVTSTSYVCQVDHEYQPYVGFYTTVTVDRGNGFVERIRREGSPYWAEMTDIE